MNHTKMLLFLLLAIGMILFVGSPGSMNGAYGAELDPDIKSVVDSSNSFAIDLFNQLATKDAGNLFFSPYSISAALAMTYAGARGETANQMERVLHFSLHGDALHAAQRKLADKLKSPHADDKELAYRLVIANELWGQRGFPYNSAFFDLLQQDYDAELHQVDFATERDRTCEEINAWVEQATQKKIQGMLQPSDLNALTRLVLINAIYFKASWSSPFPKERTTMQTFYCGQGNDVSVPLMVNNEIFSGIENDDFQAISIFYEGDMEMIVLLPRKIDGLPALQKQLTPTNLTLWRKEMRLRRSDIYLPKFRIESRFELTRVLAAMGMKNAFDQRNADFGGISTGQRLYLSEVVHKAFVDVNEEGTESAAATALGMTALNAPPPMAFRADHPFIFVIRDANLGQVLFVGQVTNPAK